MRLLSFGTVTLPEVNAQNQFPVPFRSSLVALQNGAFDQDGTDTYLEQKVVSATFWVATNDASVSDIDAYIESLYQVAANGRARLLARRRDGTTVHANAKLVQAQLSVDSRQWKPTSLDVEGGYDTMNIAFEISYPYWLSVDDESKLLDEGWLADGSFTFEAGLSETNTFNSGSLSWSPTFANDGNSAHERMTIIIEGLTGLSSVGDLNITNTTTGDTIEWTGTLTDGDSVTINTLAQTVKKNGSNDYANVNLPTTQIPFLTMAVGDNDFTFVFDSITGGQVDITVTWARHYVR